MSTGQVPAHKSTIDRTVLALRLGAMRVAFRSLERLAPRRGARWAVRLFSRPPTVARPRDDRPAPGSISRLEAAGSSHVVVETWGTGDPVYLLHGWGGWRGQLGAFVEPLVAAGHRVVAVDAPSHGDSAHGAFGRGRSTMLEFAQTLTAVVAAHGTAAAVIAHSMGGAATALAIRDGLAVPRVVFVAPAADPVSQTRIFAQHLGIGDGTHREMLVRLEELAGRPISDLDVRTLDLARTPRALVVHDLDDREVPYADGEAIATAWPAAELVTTSGLGHRRILRDSGVVRLAVDHVRGRDAPAPPRACSPGRDLASDVHPAVDVRSTHVHHHDDVVRGMSGDAAGARAGQVREQGSSG